MICQEAVLHDSMKIAKHLADKCKKKMALKAYYWDYVVPSGGVRLGGNQRRNQNRGAAQPIDPDVHQKCVKWLYQCEW